MKKIVLLTMLALSCFAVTAVADNPAPICVILPDGTRTCPWVR